MFLSDFLAGALNRPVAYRDFSWGVEWASSGKCSHLFSLFFFFGTWAGGVWIYPIGSPIGGVSWISFVLVGVVFRSGLNGPDSPCKTRKETTIGSSR